MTSGTTTFLTLPRTNRAASDPKTYAGDLRRAKDGRPCVDDSGAIGSSKCQHTQWRLAYDDNDRTKTYDAVITEGWSKTQAMSFISTDHSNNDNYNVAGGSTCNGEPSSCRQLHGPFGKNEQTVTKTINNLKGHDTVRVSLR